MEAESWGASAIAAIEKLDQDRVAPSGDDIQEGLVTALESIKNFVEEGRSGGKEEPSAAT